MGNRAWLSVGIAAGSAVVVVFGCSTLRVPGAVTHAVGCGGGNAALDVSGEAGAAGRMGTTMDGNGGDAGGVHQDAAGPPPIGFSFSDATQASGLGPVAQGCRSFCSSLGA